MDIVDPIKGKLPKIDPHPQIAPQVAVVEKPKLAMDAAINVQKDIKLPDNPNMPNIGVTQLGERDAGFGRTGDWRRHGNRFGRRAWLRAWQWLRSGLGRQCGRRRLPDWRRGFRAGGDL